MGYVAIVIFMFGIGILVHQNFMTSGGWFNLEQFLHHENMAVMCFVSAISLLVGRYLRGK